MTEYIAEAWEADILDSIAGVAASDALNWPSFTESVDEAAAKKQIREELFCVAASSNPTDLRQFVGHNLERIDKTDLNLATKLRKLTLKSARSSVGLRNDEINEILYILYQSGLKDLILKFMQFEMRQKIEKVIAARMASEFYEEL